MLCTILHALLPSHAGDLVFLLIIIIIVITYLLPRLCLRVFCTTCKNWSSRTFWPALLLPFYDGSGTRTIINVPVVLTPAVRRFYLFPLHYYLHISCPGTTAIPLSSLLLETILHPILVLSFPHYCITTVWTTYIVAVSPILPITVRLLKENSSFYFLYEFLHCCI